MSVQTVPTAAALIIGNELLTGKVSDANLSVLARTLCRLGIRLERAHTVRDDMATIASEVRALSETHRWVFTSGGVGPTHDDLTMDAVARAFGCEVTVSDELHALLTKHFGEKLTESHLRMARVPMGSRLIRSEKIPWPVVQMHNVWVLPGVPEIFALKLRLIEDELGGVGVPIISISLTLQRDEGYLKPHLDEIVRLFPHVEVGSYPRFSDTTWRTKITFDGTDLAVLQQARAGLIGYMDEGEPHRLDED